MPYCRPGSAVSVPLLPLTAATLPSWLEQAPARHRQWLAAMRFEAKPGKWCTLPGSNGEIEAVLFGMQDAGWLYQLAGLANALPEGNYRLQADWQPEQLELAALGWGLARYSFERYKKRGSGSACLELDPQLASRVEPLLAAQTLVRDLVNTPAEDLGPEELAASLSDLAERFGARAQVLVGEELLASNFPAVHAVGRAARKTPRLAWLSWGEADRPLVALVGKGVCFDSGGLDIKNATGMALMKKDMGGAAHVLALAQLVMEHELPVHLLVVVPAVENAIAGDAYRPGDILTMRKGTTVEISNTDAEGRLVLADGLAFACEHQPDLLLDFATLTGAARIAMGPDLPPLFSNRPELAQGLLSAGLKVEDPMWELPLHKGYREMLNGSIADLTNSPNSTYAGCITAALFLQEFVSPGIPWAHVDTFAWNQNTRPGRPMGGEALGLRAAWQYLNSVYG